MNPGHDTAHCYLGEIDWFVHSALAGFDFFAAVHPEEINVAGIFVSLYMCIHGGRGEKKGKASGAGGDRRRKLGSSSTEGKWETQPAGAPGGGR